MMNLICVTLLSVPHQDLSIIVTHYKTPNILKHCLERLERYASGASIIVVNSGADDTLNAIITDFPDIKSVQVVNHSMAATVNAGLDLADRPYILQMNADVFIEKNSLSDLRAILQREGVGMVGPICVSKEAKLQNQGLFYYRYYAFLKLFKRPSVNANWLSGCCMLVRKEALESVGGLNTELRFYNEDMEWCWRFQKAGWQTHLVNTTLTHLGGSSTPENPNFIIEGYRGAYLLSCWYKPKWYQYVHRAFVLLESAWQARFAVSLSKRQAYKTIYKLFKAKQFDTSPFGETLERSNPMLSDALP